MTSTDPATQRAALENTALAARHDRQWALRVVAVWQLRPRMRRIQLTGADLGDFKPNPGQELIVLIPAPAGETLRRHYAIRRYEPASRLIDSDVLAYAFIQIGDPREFQPIDSRAMRNELFACGLDRSQVSAEGYWR